MNETLAGAGEQPAVGRSERAQRCAMSRLLRSVLRTLQKSPGDSGHVWLSF